MAEAVLYSLDLRGEVCPINWVKTKLRLEEMAVGEHLEVFLDDGEPIQNVPRSARAEGHRVLRLERSGGHWRVIIEKGD